MKVAFINDSCERLGVEYISAVLKQHGHTVKLFADPQLFNDENFTIAPLAGFFDQQEELLVRVREFQPDLVAFSVVTDFYQWACRLARRVKAVMDVPVLFGGIHATSVPEKVLQQDCVDMVCRGEGEFALLDLVNNMEKGRRDYAIPNIWFKKNGAIIRND
ncbi:MAG TPA: cobalamin-dependent protein, partial [Candidatus Omnitrophota bacterium]|nr:cobalamin-dependent protein [Candidatus Omnitrophota bacterium]